MMDYYDILGVNKNATQDEIKKAYKKLAIKTHPDRPGGSKEKFQDVGKAYKVLSDSSLRQKYDTYGEEGLQGGGMEGFNPFDLFSGMNSGGGFGNLFGNMFNMGGNQNSKHKPEKGPDMKYNLNVKMEDLYKGKTMSLKIKKDVRCDICLGKGCQNDGDILECDMCQGKGKIMKVKQFGPMIQQIVQPCYKCEGEGKMMRPGSECGKCNGNKIISEEKKVEFYIKPGSKQGDTIILYGDSNWKPEFVEAGDLHIIINEQKALNGMNREGENLVYKKDISLVDSLCGVDFIITHLDDRKLRVQYDNIIKPNQKFCITGEGMPLVDDMQSGDLIVIFNVIFPDNLTQERKVYLRKLLPNLKKQIWDLSPEDYPDIETKNLQLVNDKHNHKDNERRNNKHHERDNDQQHFFNHSRHPNMEHNMSDGPGECTTQ